MLGTDEKQSLPEHEEKKLMEHQHIEMLESKKKKADELEERIMRLQADFENYKKRMLKENDNIRQNSGAEVLVKILPIADEFEIALQHAHNADPEFKRGMELIYSKILDILKNEGVQEMDVEGHQFDPYRHDAIRQEIGEDGKIIEVVQKGYLFKGKILRHAKVVVGKKGDKI
ncbi:nucleotide exchange factor GrpE [Candidatus Micrarchaeota archaeon]|nr:nucleotide exchange factor GrpE [Candidatus Micrarchaeota archaeon]MBU1166545.1 nucleotide exchange factor GrpE [Candidatus Micrarchaeota archaeon]MBU1887557.1 nucleotide exchange factor GrpE [Candidatus Micrarchaeota archaeon]